MKQHLQDASGLPGHPGKDRAKALTLYSFQLLGEHQPFRNASSQLRMAYDDIRVFSGEQLPKRLSARHSKKQPALPSLLAALELSGLHAFLYPVLKASWEPETSAEWFYERVGPGEERGDTRKPKVVGQEIATAILLQEVIGGKLFVANHHIHSGIMRVWNLLERDGVSLEADLTQPRPCSGEQPNSEVKIASRKQLLESYGWAEQATDRLMASFKAALLAYATVAHKFCSRSPP